MNSNKLVIALLFTVALFRPSFALDITSRKINLLEIQLDSPTTLSHKLQVPIGIEIYYPPETAATFHKPRSINHFQFNDATIAHVLDVVCRGSSSTWRETDGVIDIFPETYPNQANDYLDREVHDAVYTSKTREEIIGDILAAWKAGSPSMTLEAVQSGVKSESGLDLQTALVLKDGGFSLAFFRTSIYSGFQHAGDGKEIIFERHSFVFKGMTLRRVLNQIAKAENIGWMAIITDGGNMERIEFYKY